MILIENERIYPMPELFSRMDNLNWLTPPVAEILDQGSTPPGGDGSIRERMLMIQRELDELDTPARIVNVRSNPSYTLYIARPETVGRSGSRHTITSDEIKQSIKKIAENHKDWLLGFIPQLREDDTTVGILIRTDEHRPMSLRRLLVRTAFRKHPSTLAFVLGITLEQQIIIDSIDTIGHMLIVGKDKAKQHFIRSTLLSLIMLNTPSELRVAIAGESSDAYKYLVGAPHALGHILTSPNEGKRIIDGLIKEIQRRKQSLRDEGVSNIIEYNNLADQLGKSEFPRIVMILDSLTDESWQSDIKSWSTSISELLINGAQVGIHLIIAVDDESNLELPTESLNEIALKVVMRASSKDISVGLPHFHVSLLRFIDAFVFDKKDTQDRDIIPVELCAISNSEIKNVVEYWRQMSKQRYQDVQAAKSSTKTRITGILNPPPELEQRSVTPPTPPTPEKPSVSTLVRATQVIGTQLSDNAKPTEHTNDVEDIPIKELEIEASIITEDAQLVEPTLQKTSMLHEEGPIATEDAQLVESTLQKTSMLHEEASFTVPEASAIITEESQTIESSDESTIVHQAIALSAYLGWISRGALCDIFYVSREEADQIITQLQEQNIVEQADYPTLRFVRLEQSSNGIY
jgi:hypothetical protein